MILTADQGAIVTLNGGATWSSWYNQPTAQFYHVSTDNAFPYRVCSGQQESGSVCIQSRGDDGQITFREWTPVGVEEYGFVAPDPADPDIVYGGKTWVPFKGAPGGEDYQGGWINPDNPDIVLMVADQGAVVSLNGGESWSSWYNQPTAQLYHVSADNAFPYRVCSGQPESGWLCVASRGNYGVVSVRD